MKSINFAAESGSPDSAAWHAWRAAGLGASDACVVAAHHGLCSKPKWAKAIGALLAEKAGLSFTPDRPNRAMMRGRDGEAAALRAFEEAAGLALAPAFGESDEHPWLRASFDGLDFMGATLAEVKCPALASHKEAKNGVVPDYYLVQMAHQGLVAWGHPAEWRAGERRAFYVSYHPETGDLAYVEVDVSELAALAGRYLPLAIRFWDEVLKARAQGVAPEPTEPAVPLPPDLAADAKAAADEFLSLSAQASALDERLAAARKRLIDAARAAGGRLEAFGVLAYETEVQGAVDYAKAIKDLGVTIDLDKYRKASTKRATVRAVANA